MSNLIRDIFEGFRKVNASASDPFRVLEMSIEDCFHHEIICRKDCLVLYRSSTDEKQKLEIVIQVDINHHSVNRASKVFSLMRSEDETEIQFAFIQMQEKIPILVECVPELGLSKLSLQAISQVIRENPTWSAAHISAHFGYVDCFRNKIISSQINQACDISMQTPLHTAIKAQQLTSVSALIALDVATDVVDCNVNSVFHYAATTTKEIIQALASKPVSSVINMLNNDGHTALYLACMADKPECVKALLKAGADVNMACIIDGNDEIDCRNNTGETSSKSLKEVLHTHSQRLFINDMKNGGTPLHWSKTSELTEILIEYGCHIDARNFQGDTALHLMVLRSRISCAVMLLSHGANADIQGSDGNTPLHLAVKSGDIYLVYTFVTFGADVNKVNNKGETPRHLVATERRVGYEEMLYALHIVGAERCTRRLSSCNEGCEPGGHFNGIPSENPPILKKTDLYEELLGAAVNPSMKIDCVCNCNGSSSGDNMNHATQRCNVLCLDGGGIRGLVLIQLLDQLERVVGVPIMQCFDWVSGTSTGGVLALLLASGKTVRECRCLYFRLKDKVFVGTRPYDAEPLEKFLQKELGDSTVMSDITDCRVMVTATKADRHPAELHIFRNYDSPIEILQEDEMDSFHQTPSLKPREQLVWQAARATGAAPTYFRASGQFLDGGLIANNPTLDTLTEIHQCNQSHIATGQEDKVREIEAVVSLGTGKSPVVAVNTIDVFRPDSLWGACKMALGVSAISQLLVDQATQTDGRVTTRAQAICSMLNIPYYRLNPQLSENIGLDSTDTNTLVKVLWETTAYMYSIREELEQLAKLLRR